jgi:hypothetical protein
MLHEQFGVTQEAFAEFALLSEMPSMNSGAIPTIE